MAEHDLSGKDAAVVVETIGHKMYIYLNRPKALNAQNHEMRGLLVQALGRLDGDDDLRVGIIAGVGGRAFSAGADLNEPKGTLSGAAPGQIPPGMIHFEAARWTVKPLIAAIDGHCVGGGLEFANYCDIRVATESSTFGQPEPRTIRGTGIPALHQLVRTMPLGEAMLIMLTSRPMPARRAYEIGLIQRLCADRAALFAEAELIADQIIECDPTALMIAKRFARMGQDMTAEQVDRMSDFTRGFWRSTPT